MKKQYKSSIIKNHRIRFLMVFPKKVTKPLKLFLDFAPKTKKSIVGISSDY